MASFNSAAYAQSQINWDELRKLAKEVAIKSKVPRDTVEVIEYETESYLLIFSRKKEIMRKVQVDYWVLTMRWQREFYAGRKSKREIDYFYCLRVDGELIIREQEYYFSPDGSLSKLTPKINVMTERDVLKFDFHPKDYHQVFPNGEIEESNKWPSDQLLVSNKGMGLVSLLNKLT